MTLGRVARSIPLLLLCWGGTLLVDHGWMAAKAHLAALLIDRAYAAHLRDGADHRPWHWADTHPVARLRVPRLGLSRTVLAGAGGHVLAFGPGHIDGTALPGTAGNTVIAGHRDGWFALLGELQVGDSIVVESRYGTRAFRVVALEVRSMWDSEVTQPTAADRLTLVTCWPFDTRAPGDLRFVAIGLPEGNDGAPPERRSSQSRSRLPPAAAGGHPQFLW